jgi:hypothetical protein
MVQGQGRVDQLEVAGAIQGRLAASFHCAIDRSLSFSHYFYLTSYTIPLPAGIFL